MPDLEKEAGLQADDEWYGNPHGNSKQWSYKFNYAQYEHMIFATSDKQHFIYTTKSDAVQTYDNSTPTISRSSVSVEPYEVNFRNNEDSRKDPKIKLQDIEEGETFILYIGEA